MKQDKGLKSIDTVMGKDGIFGVIVASDKNITYSPQYYTDNKGELRAVAKAQAEITWDKAKAHYEPLIQEAVKAERERIEGLLDVHENELGFCEISNHIPYSNFKGGN